MESIEHRLATVESQQQTLRSRVKDHEQEIHSLQYILNGNGELGLVGRVKIIWYMVNKLALVISFFLGTVITAPDQLALLRGCLMPRKKTPTANAPPSWLDDQAQLYWPDVIQRLQERGLLAAADPSSIIRLTQALAQYRLAKIRLNKEGQVVTEEHPTYSVEKVHPAFRVQESLVKQISGLLAELGLLEPPNSISPQSSHTDAEAETADAPLDGLAAWLARARQGCEN